MTGADVGRARNADDCIGAAVRFIDIQSFIFINESRWKDAFELQIDVSLEMFGNSFEFN